MKLAEIGHVITQAVRPRSVLSPLLFGISVEMDGPRWLIDELCNLGFGISYDDVNTFKQSILQDRSVNCFASAESQPNQFVADNADFNVQTLDGLGTFHGLGMIQISKLKKKELARL